MEFAAIPSRRARRSTPPSGDREIYQELTPRPMSIEDK